MQRQGSKQQGEQARQARRAEASCESTIIRLRVIPSNGGVTGQEAAVEGTQKLTEDPIGVIVIVSLWRYLVQVREANRI